MSDTEKPLAEKLRAYLDAENGVRAARRALPPECSAWPETSMASYLRGYDDARAECAADIEENGVLTRRVQELEAQLAAPQPAAVGVVGKWMWGVMTNMGVFDVPVAFSTRAEAEAQASRGERVVAIVDLDAIVPLASAEPVRWIGTLGRTYHTRVDAVSSSETIARVVPLHEGVAQPAQEREG